ncbi:hypothetical protein FACS1894166_00580 [Bacilli bacterium]|nr:hypothetical protein FACS1894166_00580 [Bacilli bacterium]
MNKNKSLGCDSIKKRKILLGTLIPLGCLVVATAVVVPVVLTQCGGQQKKFNSAQDMKLYVEKHLKLSIKEGVDFSQKESNDVAMVS